MKNKLVYILLVSTQVAYCDNSNISDFINSLRKNKISNVEYNSAISEISENIELTDKDDQKYFLIDGIQPYLSPQLLVEKIGPALNNLTPLLRKNILSTNNQGVLANSILALAMVNDISSINHIRRYLYDSDWYVQYIAYKSLVILSAFDGKVMDNLVQFTDSHWFSPLQSTKKYAFDFIKQDKKITSWDIFQFNKEIDKVFYEKFNSCSFDNRLTAGEIKTDLKNNEKNLKKQVNNIIEEMDLSKKFIKRLQENLSNHHFFLQYPSRLLGLSKNNIIVDINTKTFKPIFVFNLSSRTYVILRGDHQIENDKISELIYSKNEYKLESRFTLIYKVENIMNSGKEKIRLIGQNWFLDIDKKNAIIKNGVVCGEKVKLELGI